MKQIFIVSNNSTGSKYGVGTYIRQLINCFDTTQWDVNILELYSSAAKEPSTIKENNITYFKIPNYNQWNNKMDYSEVEKFYYNAIFQFIAPYIKTKDAYFHFNFMQGHELASLLKNKSGVKIILTVHYMDWSFDLLGDKNRLKEIIQNPQSNQDKIIKLRFEKEKTFVQECADYIIAIARHSYQTLQTLYEIPTSRLFFIPNALEDSLIEYNATKKKALRKKFGFKPSEKLILFAGRLDSVKGVSKLIDSFLQINKEVPDARLVIAGSGDFNKYFEAANPKWPKITFTGFIEKEDLRELYSVADIGVVPSIHEEFGYVALEMMMHKLPVIVSNSTGLKEIAENGKYAYTVDVNNKMDKDENLKNAIFYFLNNKHIQTKYKQEGRLRYENEYSISMFSKRINQLYISIQNDIALFNNINSR